MQMKQVAPKTAGPELFDSTQCNCLALRQAARHVSQIYDRHLAKVGLRGTQYSMARHVSQIYDRHLAKVGLRGTQYSILSKLSRLGALPIGRLAEALVLDRTALGRALRPLERARLVAVGAGPDGRTRSVRLTAAGEARFAQAVVEWRKAQKEFEGGFGADAAQALRASLLRVVEAA